MLLDDGTLLLTRHHELETVKVCQGSLLGLGGQLLAPCRLCPSVCDLVDFQSLLQGLGAGVTGDLDGEVGEGDTLEGDDLAEDAAVGAFDEDLLVCVCLCVCENVSVGGRGECRCVYVATTRKDKGMTFLSYVYRDACIYTCIHTHNTHKHTYLVAIHHINDGRQLAVVRAVVH